MKILGIETSCDDTSICILDNTKILSHLSFSQEEILSKWGGIIPEIAARNHLEKITPLLKDACEQATINPQDLDLIGVTTHPGLLGPLLTGLNAAKTLSLLHQIPLRPVNHLYAHLEAIHLTQQISYPYIGMLISGGHSIYFKVSSSANFEVLGSTVDDAAGEAFDKGAKLMGLGYPGGKVIDQLARQGDAKKYKFPIGLEHSKNCNLSFSGVKTALRNFLEQNSSFSLEDLCASYQQAIINALCKKLKFAHQKGLPIVVGGGVACNSALRQKLHDNFDDIHFVAPKFCTDNGAMIANYARLTADQSIPFPDCLELDAKGKFIKKKDFCAPGR